MKKIFINGFKMLFFFTLLTGLLYPLVIVLSSQLLFPHKANGSFIEKNSSAIGSKLIAQKFTNTKYFWPRPSAVDYHPLPSGATNFSQTSAALKKDYDAREKTFLINNFLNSNYDIPKEMLFSSASGVDPHISPEAAYSQVNRIVKERDFNDGQRKELCSIIYFLTEGPQLGFLGKSVINVLLLNLELDKIKQ